MSGFKYLKILLFPMILFESKLKDGDESLSVLFLLSILSWLNLNLDGFLLDVRSYPPTLCVYSKGISFNFITSAEWECLLLLFS